MSIGRFTYDRHTNMSHISRIEPQLTQQKLIKYQHKIFQKQNQVDSIALQQYLNSVRASKIGRQRVFTQKTEITYIINNLFNLLKRMMMMSLNQTQFTNILNVYTELIKSKENSRHHSGLIQYHLKDVLSLDSHRKNKKIYLFLSKVFQFSPYIVYKILQSKPQFLQWNSQQSLKIYELFIKYAADKKNIALIQKFITNCISKKQPRQIERLKILLANPSTAITPNLIININNYINQITNQVIKSSKKQFENCLLQTIKLFVSLQWPRQTVLNKNDVIIKYLNKQSWRNPNYQKKISNAILDKLEFNNQSLNWMKSQIKDKVNQFQKESKNLIQTQNFRAIQIILRKLGKQKIQEILTEQQIKMMIDKCLSCQLKENVVDLLQTIKRLGIYSSTLSHYIHASLKKKIQIILSRQVGQTMKQTKQRAYSVKQQFQANPIITLQDKRLALKALRHYKFDSFQIYYMLKVYVFKKQLAINKNQQIKKQVIKVCLYSLTNNGNIDKIKIMRQILNLINKDLTLKLMTVQWFRQHQKLYDKKIFQIFKQKEYMHILFQYYASNHMVMKRFSIKVLCYIYPLEQCDIVPFLKRVYNHIYDRLSSDNIVSFEQKKQALRLTRQILRHRTQIIYDDASALCNFLYNHLYRAQDYDQLQMNEILTQLFKTIIDLIRKIPRNVFPYAHPIADYIIKLLNSKDSDQKVKTVALGCFNQLIRGCSYVLIPYFHFKNLFEIIRQIFKEGGRGMEHQQILRLLGNLGFTTKDKFDRVRALSINTTNHRQINKYFQKSFKQTNYIKQIKNEKQVQIIQNSGLNGPFLFTKQQTTYTYIQIANYKKYILVKINKILSQHPSKMINYLVFKVLQSFTQILSKEQQNMYQQTVLGQILKTQILKQSYNSVFTLVSKIVRFQNTQQSCNKILKYLLNLFDDKKFSWKLELVQLMYLLTVGYPQNNMKDDVLVRKIVSRITQFISKPNASTNQIKIGLKIIQNLSQCIDSLIHLFLPQFNKSFLSTKSQTCLCYFQVLLELCKKAPSTQFYLPPISQSLIQLLKFSIKKMQELNNSLFIQKIIDFGLCLMLIYGDRFKGFISQFRDALKNYPYPHLMYNIASDYMKKHSSLNYLQDAYEKFEIDELQKKRVDLGIKRYSDNFYVDIPHPSSKVYSAVIQQFNCQKNQIEDQSQEWFNKICISIFQKSPQLFVHECLPLVREDRGFCSDIFPVAFYFFWNSLEIDGQKQLRKKLQIILKSEVISLGVKQKILDTVYFMAQWKVSIPLQNKFLRDVSIKILDEVKALFYMQSLFQNDPETEGQGLIKMYAKLQQKQSAIGLLKIVKNLNIKTKIQLNQKLKRYHDALKQYDKLEDSLNPKNMLIQITIRKQMSDWQSVHKLCTNQSNKNPGFKSQLAPLAVQASINLGKWDQVRNWLPSMDKNHQNLNLWKTMLKIEEKQYTEAQKYIYQDRNTIYPKICQLFNFSFQRSMEGIIRLQQLCELQQATAYLKIEQSTPKNEEADKKSISACAQYKKRLQNLWNDRIQGSKNNLNAMQLLLMTRNLLLTKTEDINNWIDYCHLALRENQSQIAKKTLKMLDEQLEQSQDVKKKFEIQTLLIQTKFILGQLKDQQAVALIEKNIQERGTSKSDQSICRLYYNCAIWLSQKQYDFTIEKGNKCIEMLKKTTHKIKNFIKGWHLMGLMHLKIDQLLRQKRKAQKKASNKLNDQQEAQTSVLKQIRETHIFQALHCFIKSVSCGLKNHGFFLQDCLKIMNILFKQNQVTGLVEQLNKYFTQIPADGLIDIIPQIIGRLDIVQKPKLLDMMKKLLIHIGQNHPQALVFYLVFLRKGKNQTRKKIAQDIYKQISKKQNQVFPILYNQTQLIVGQLCKVSLKLNQKFRIWLEKLFQDSKDPKLPLKETAIRYIRICQKFKKQPLENLSNSQFGFIQQYKQDMSDIVGCLTLYLNINQSEYFRKAQRIITKILAQLKSSLKQIKKLQLNETSPLLIKTVNTHVSIPGFYKPNEQTVYISSFYNQLDVIKSKQRPKKLIIIGSDSKQYLFLLKGKQDLRLDQRIMQLFNLINKMFHDPIERQNYSIKGYSITPISSQTGLIEWVQNCDTIGDLIIDHRTVTIGYKKREIQKQISMQICKDYKNLAKAHKVQIYKQIESRVSGNDLKNIFWVRSSNSQQWLRNRSCYIRSLAVMSIVGYVIGLGDRHPFNIMIQRNTGKVVHIDFGDCFDVNKTRSQYPQKVPFRLTRMLVKNMEPCGIHGIFKHTCQKIIKMLRNNKQSIIAIIQAFRYDPIIGWRLKGENSMQMLQNSYQNNQTEQSYLDEEKQKEKENKMNEAIDKQNNQFAQHILNQIKKKLGGKSADQTNKIMSPEQHVNVLIKEAMSPQNLVEHYEGWCIYW